MFKLYGMNDEDYNLNRQVSDFFDQALGLGLADDIKHIDNDRYLPGSQIARGGMKSIEIAVDTVTGREVAKALLIGNDDPEKVERFFHEARICASLEHPNIVPVYDAGYDAQGQPFFTMRLLGGLTLQKTVKKENSKRANLLDTFVKVCDAVSYAHSQGIIHRDLKPENIQIGGFGEVQVCDWGLACRDGYKKNETRDSSTKEYVIPVTLDGMIKGTPGYLAPEQAASTKQELTATTDIYSLGAILYFILSQKAPLEDYDTTSTIKKTLSGEVESLKTLAPDTPNSLVAICEKAMSTDAADRYPTVEALKADIVKYQHGFPTAAEDAGAWSSLKLFIKRNQKTALLTASFLIIFNSTLIWFLINVSAKEKQARDAEAEAKQAAEIAHNAEQNAREAEAEATRNAELAQMSEKTTEEAMHSTRQALEKLKAVSQKAAPRFIRLGKMEKSAFQYKTALEFLDQALDYAPGNLDALDAKAKILLALLRFKEADDIFRNLKNVNKNLLTVTENMSTRMAAKQKADLDDIYALINLYKKYKMSRLYLEELVYSPALDFINEQERRQLAVDTFILYRSTNSKNFTDMKPMIEKSMPLLLYRTGVQTFDLRRLSRSRTHMIRGEKTERVVLPEGFNLNIAFTDLKECPNLKEIYFPKNFKDRKFFNKLNVKIFDHKEYQ